MALFDFWKKRKEHKQEQKDTAGYSSPVYNDTNGVTEKKPGETNSGEVDASDSAGGDGGGGSD